MTTDAGGTYARVDGSTDPTLAACGHARRQQEEPSIAVDPGDTRIVVVGVNDDCADVVNGSPWVGYYRSTDGGRTWHPSLVPGYPADTSSSGLASPTHGRCQAASDPSLAFDRAGRLFYGFVCFGVSAGRGTFGNAVSTFVAVYDRDGSHYVRTVLLDQGSRTFAEDKINVAVDQTRGPHAGNVYAAWDELAPPAPGGFPRDLLRVARSTNHGVGFSKPQPASAIHHVVFPDLAVGPTGTVYMAFQVEGQFWMGISTDGGAHFDTPNLVGDSVPFESGQFALEEHRECGDGPFECRTGFTFPRFDTYQSVVADAAGVHVAWSARNVHNQAKVFVRSSPDGRTWTQQPRQVDSAPVGHQWFPDLASAHGTLTVAFYDSRMDPAYAPSIPPGNTTGGTNSGPVVNVVAASSRDGGRTWTERRVTDRGFNPNIEAFDRVPFLGDYISAVPAGSGVLVAWTDLRDVVRGTDPRERGQDDDDDGFDVFLPCRWRPPGIDAPSYRAPRADDPCLSRGGLDQNAYLARLP